MPLRKTGSKARFRHETVKPKGRFDPRSFRTKKVGASRVIIGCPKGKYSPSKGICKVGTQAQAILRPLKKNAMSIQEFAQRVYEDRKTAFKKRWGHEYLDIENECAVRIVPGKKYTKVDVGPRNNWSGRYMIDKDGNIFGIKAYGVIHKGRRYGNLDTVDQYFWGEYYPIKIKQESRPYRPSDTRSLYRIKNPCGTQTQSILRPLKKNAVLTKVGNNYSWVQMSYDKMTPKLRSLLKVARQRGLRAYTSDMGPQVTPLGIIKLRMATIDGNINLIEDELRKIQPIGLRNPKQNIKSKKYNPLKRNQQIPTAKIRRGITVLAHPDGYAKTYVNYTQAAKSVKKLNKLGINAEVYQSRIAMQCFYVRILNNNRTKKANPKTLPCRLAIKMRGKATKNVKKKVKRLVNFPVLRENIVSGSEIKYSSRPDWTRKFGKCPLVGWSKSRGVYYYKNKYWIRQESIAGSWGKMIEILPFEITEWRKTKEALKLRLASNPCKNLSKQSILEKAESYASKLYGQGKNIDTIIKSIKNKFKMITMPEAKYIVKRIELKGRSAWRYNKTNSRKKWYYGPSVQHRGKILVFPSAKSPTKTTHGRYIKNAVGPYASKISAMNAAKGCIK